MKTLLSNIHLFYSFATQELRKTLHEIENLETYKDRIDCAEKNLEHLSSGSSRIVYKSHDGTIIKLAKNDKGIAQNKAEGNKEMKSKFLNEIIDQAANHSWIETHFLEKITEKEFEKMTKLDFDDFGKAIKYGLKDVSEDSNQKSKHFDDVAKSEIYKEIKKIGDKFHIMPGDIARISSWGCKDNHPVLIDAGLTKEIYDKFYSSSSS